MLPKAAQRQVATVTGDYSTEDITVEAPLIALVPIPALLVQTVDIALTVNVDNKLSAGSTSTATLGASGGIDDWFYSLHFTGNYSTTVNNTRSTDYRAQYTVKVAAQQQTLPEGMSRLMDVVCSCINPMPAVGTKGTSGKSP